MPNIVSPRPGQVIVGDSLELMVGTPDYKMVDFEKNTKVQPGMGHLHIWVDQTNLSKASAIKATSNIYKLTKLAPGRHTVVVELVTNNHSSFVPKKLTSVSFVTTAPKPEPKKLQSPLMLTVITLVLLLIATYLMLSKPKILKKTKK